MNIHKFPYEMGEAVNLLLSPKFQKMLMVKSMFNTDRAYNFYTHKFYPK